jgi:VWFA-related protein
MLRVPSVLLTLAFSSLFAGTAFAQTPPPPESEAPATTLKATTRNVLLDVVVTDKRDKPVSGLRKEDFQVLEDGKPQTISFFETAFAGTPGAASAVPAPPLPPNTFTNVPAVAPNNAVNVLLMDALNTNMGDQSLVHKEMVRYLASIPPGTRIGIMLLSERLRIVQGITQDSTLLRASLARLAANPSQSALLLTIGETEAQLGAVNMIMQQGVENNSTQIQASATALQDFLAQQNTFEANMRSAMTMEALQQIARYLSGIPGRKNLIWVVGSFPACIGTECPIAYMDVYKKTMDALANARVSVYPIDARGITLNMMHDVENSKPPGLAGNSQQAIAAQAASLNSDAAVDASNQGNMDRLAKETGGKATFNSNDFKEALAVDIDNGSRYYTLAYTPINNRELGKERKIEIKTASGSYKLAYRRSYFEDSPKDLKAAQTASPKDQLRPLMDRGMPNFTELSYREKLAPASVQPAADAPIAGDNAALKAPFTRYSVNLALSPDGLGLVPGPDGVRRGSIEVAMVAYDQQGKALNWQVRFLGLAIRPEQNAIAQASGIPFHFDFDLPPGDVYLRTGIYDASTSKAGTLELQLNSVTPAPQ